MTNKKIGRNEPCSCGSGKKYKKCCLKEKEWYEMMYRKMSNGEIPFSAYVKSDGNTAPISVEITNAGFGNEDGYKEVLSNKIKLSNNTVKGDLVPSEVFIQIPVNGEAESKVSIKGNAMVETSNKQHFNLAIFNEKKKLSVEGSENLFAKIMVKSQHDADYSYIDILFGERGKKEQVIDGDKNRPHVAFYTEGNGKYIRIAEYKCKISQDCTYIDHDNLLIPNQLKIELEEYNQFLILEFCYLESSNTILISRADFEQV